MSDKCLQCFRKPMRPGNPFCSSRCADQAGIEAPRLIKIPVDHNLFDIVSSRFLGGWDGHGVPYIKRVFLITCDNDTTTKFEDYRSEVASLNNANDQGDVRYKFRGLHRYCTLGEAGNTTFCDAPNCGLCQSLREGFGPQLRLKQMQGGMCRLGPGIYTSGNSFKADLYAANCHSDILHRAQVACRVVLGKAFETFQDMRYLRSPPPGYNSVFAVPGMGSSFTEDERVVYDERAIIPVFLIMYNKW